MRHTAWLVLLGSVPAVPQDGVSAKYKIQARVDPRVELMSIIFRLAGNPEYNQPNSKSPYADEVEVHFGKFRNHPVVRSAQQLRAERGVSYDAVMSMAVHLENTTTLKEKIPFDKAPPRLDARWHLKEARDFLQKARSFVADSKFNEFLNAHEELYRAAGARMTEKLGQRPYLEWFDAFFGARPGAEFRVIVGMLNGGCCYSAGVQHLDGREEISPVLGVWRFDDEGIPVVGDDIVGTVVHEFCHSYTNPLVDKYAEQLEPAGGRIFRHCAQAMRQQAYGNWKTMMYESLVRVCVVRYLLASEGDRAARKAIREQHERGFKWIGALSKVLDEYESDRERYPTFDAFMPKVIQFFDKYAGQYEDLMARAPKVVAMSPANGATDVDPNLKEIKVTFDRPMMDKCWAVVGGGPHFPEIVGELSYDQACKVLTIPVRLKPGWSYQFWLNRGKFSSFQSQEGIPLESVAVTFETRRE